ncbi:MAG: tetratricopeptide repeat protein [Acidobacteriota bacterium]
MTVVRTLLAALIATSTFAAQPETQRVPDTTIQRRQSVAEQLRLAQEAFRREDWPAAIREYEKLVKIAPERTEFQFQLAVAHYSSGQPQEAVPILRKVLKSRSDLSSARDYLGASLAESGNCREALPLLKKSVSRVTDSHLRQSVGLSGVRCAMALGDTDEAVDFLRQLKRALPDDPEVLYLSAHVYSDLSIRASQELLFKAPGSYQVRLLNAEALETQGRWNDAAAEYRQVLAQNPSLPGIHYRLGRLLLSAPKTESTLEDARREFEAELKIDPGNAGAEYVLGEMARKARQWPQAIERFSKAARLDPTFADAFIGWGKSLVAAGQPELALVPLEAAVQLQRENPVAHFQLATAYRRAGRKEEADREFALHRQTSDRARQRNESIQRAVLGPPQTAEPPD